MSPRDPAEGELEPRRYERDSRDRPVTPVPSGSGAGVSHAFDTDSPDDPDADSPYVEHAGERRGDTDLSRDEAADDDFGRPTGDPAYDWKVPDLGMSVEGTRHPSLRDAGTPTGVGVDRDGNERLEPTDRVGSWTDTVVSRRISDMYAGVVRYTPQAFHHVLGRRLTAHRELIRPEDLPARGVRVEAFHDDKGVRLPEKDEKSIRLGEKSPADLGASLRERYEIYTAPTWGFSCLKTQYLGTEAGSSKFDREGWDELASRADPAMVFSVRVSSGRYDVEATGPDYSPYAEPPLGAVFPEARNQEWFLKGKQSVYLGFVEEDTLAKLERSAEEAHCARCLSDPGGSMAAERHWAGNRRVVAVAVEETGPFPEDSRIALGAAEVYDSNIWDSRERLRFAGRVAAVVGHEWETPAGTSPGDERFIESVSDHYPVLATAVAEIDPDSPLALEPGADAVPRWRVGVQRAIDVAMTDSVRADPLEDGPSVQGRILYGVGRYAEALTQSSETPVSLGPPTEGPDASVLPVRPGSDLDPVTSRSAVAVVDAVERALSMEVERRIEQVEQREKDPERAAAAVAAIPPVLCEEQVATLREAVEAPVSADGAFETTPQMRLALQRIGGVLAPAVEDVQDRIDVLKLHDVAPVDGHVASIRSEIIFTDRVTARLEGFPTPRAGSDYLRASGEEHLKPQTAECAWHMARGGLEKLSAAADDLRRERHQDLASLDRVDLLDAHGLSVGTGPDPISVADLQPLREFQDKALLRSDYAEFCDRVVDVAGSMLASERAGLSEPADLEKRVSDFRSRRDAMPVNISIDKFEKVRQQGLDLVRDVAGEVSESVADERELPSADRAVLRHAVGNRVCGEFLRPGRFPVEAEPVSVSAAARDPVEASVARVWSAVGGPDAFRGRIVPQRPEPPTLSPERVASEAGAVYASFRKGSKIEAVPGLSPAEAGQAVGASVAWRLTKTHVPGYVRPSPKRPPPRLPESSGGDLDDRTAAIARNKAIYGESRDGPAQQRAVEKAAAAVARHLRTSGRLDALAPDSTRPGRQAASPAASPGRGRGKASSPQVGDARSAASSTSKSKSKLNSQRSGNPAPSSSPKRSAVVRRAGALVGGGPAGGAGSRRATRSGASKETDPKGSRSSKR